LFSSIGFSSFLYYETKRDPFEESLVFAYERLLLVFGNVKNFLAIVVAAVGANAMGTDHSTAMLAGN
jgi:hypothetical protein